MKYLRAALCLTLLGLSACAGSYDGYYDANGTYHPENPYNAQNHSKPPIPGGPQNYNAPYPGDHRADYDRRYERDAYREEMAYASPPRRHDYGRTNAATTTVTTYHFDRAGYYDRNGYFIAEGYGPNVPRHMLPARGMCRVWFPERPAQYQPAAETCEGIHLRVPDGAYIVYGG